MANTRRGELLGGIHALFNTGGSAGLTDGQLLERFAGRRDASSELAFAALVERHGSVVLNVCEGVLRDRHDAEDAFQATFLILARRAGSIRNRDSVASWLYGVALRVASGARSSAARRRVHERNLARAAGSNVVDDGPTDDGPLLHEEVNRLPERYREPVLLCFFEGLTHEEAARQLGCPVGTVKSRLARGKDRLRARLQRRGVGCSAGFHAVPASLAEATARLAPGCLAGNTPTPGTVPASVSILMKGASRAMLLSRLKTAAALAALSLGALGVGVGVVAGGGQGNNPGSATSAEKRDADGRVKSGGRVEPGSDGPATVAALERRIEDLERKLDALLNSRQDGSRDRVDLFTTRREPESDAVHKIWPRFECRVEKVYVKSGQVVKKGDPLVDLFSTDLAVAKNDYLLSKLKSAQDDALLDLRAKLMKSGSISQQAWLDTQNAATRSRLEANVARDRLHILGLDRDEINVINDEKDDQRARFTLHSPVDGQVTGYVPVVQNFYDTRSELMRIFTGKRRASGGPSN